MRLDPEDEALGMMGYWVSPDGSELMFHSGEALENLYLVRFSADGPQPRINLTANLENDGVSTAEFSSDQSRVVFRVRYENPPDADHPYTYRCYTARIDGATPSEPKPISEPTPAVSGIVGFVPGTTWVLHQDNIGDSYDWIVVDAANPSVRHVLDVATLGIDIRSAFVDFLAPLGGS